MPDPWLGNVRELENVIRRLVVLRDGEQAVEALVTRGHNWHSSAPRSIVAEGLLTRRGAICESSSRADQVLRRG
jgi:DNA-binding NtrC family response regulator